MIFYCPYLWVNLRWRKNIAVQLTCHKNDKELIDVLTTIHRCIYEPSADFLPIFAARLRPSLVWSLYVTFLYCIETSKHILKHVLTPGTPTSLLFLQQTLWQYSNRNAIKMKKIQFLTSNSLWDDWWSVECCQQISTMELLKQFCFILVVWTPLCLFFTSL